MLALILHRGDAEGSARIANRELEFLLERGEQIEIRVPVRQRHWWDYFRVTHGVLAATNRRLLYVGVPPEELLPREPEPVELEEAGWRYSDPLGFVTRRVAFGSRSGLTVMSEGSALTLFVAHRDRARLDSVAAVVTRHLAELAAMQEAERRAVEISAEAARRPIFHLIQPGEALESIAERYGTTVDSLRAWNNLQSSRIRAGDRLLVRPGVGASR